MAEVAAVRASSAGAAVDVMSRTVSIRVALDRRIGAADRSGCTSAFCTNGHMLPEPSYLDPTRPTHPTRCH